MQLACNDAGCYPCLMAVHLQIRNLPDELHQVLRRRASARGLSLRQYTLDLLREHCQQPTLDEWLDGLSRLTPVPLSTPAAKAVQQARDAEEAALVDVRGRS
jgi:plasmid stability protein